MTAQHPQDSGEGLEHARDIETRLAELEADLTGLRAQWNGSATEAYQAAQEQWRTALHDLTGLLRPRKEPPPPPAGTATSRGGTQRRSPRWA